jgi:hypothetical protein
VALHSSTRGYNLVPAVLGEQQPQSSRRPGLSLARPAPPPAVLQVQHAHGVLVVAWGLKGAKTSDTSSSVDSGGLLCPLVAGVVSACTFGRLGVLAGVLRRFDAREYQIRLIRARSVRREGAAGPGRIG